MQAVDLSTQSHRLYPHFFLYDNRIVNNPLKHALKVHLASCYGLLVCLMLEYLLIDGERVYITREFDVQHPQL
jgi:hypothetical protein